MVLLVFIVLRKNDRYAHNPYSFYQFINMTKFISTLILTSVFVFSAKSQDTATILSKTPLLTATKEEMQNAIRSTELFIKDINQVAPLFEKFIIVGARLWGKIKDKSDFKDIENGNVTFKIPKFDTKGESVSKEDAQGKALQDIDDYLKLWTYIRMNYNLDKAQIVDENNKDKFIFWLYFAKIEEPLVTIQSDNARLILKYVKGKLFFIDITSE